VAATAAACTLFVYSCCSILYYSLYIDELLAVGSTIKAGATDIARYSRKTYIKLLRLCKVATRIVYTVDKNEHARSTHWRITNLLENMRLDNSNGMIRKQPFMIFLQGPPGSGKTTVAIRIAIDLLRAKYGKAYADEIVTLNETDEFQSEFRTNHKVVIFDDLDAEKPDRNGSKNPYRKILDFVNNVNKTSLNPNVELKGTVYIRPDIVIATSNMPLSSAVNWMNCPAAICRRVNRIIKVERDKNVQSFEVLQPEMDLTSLYRGKKLQGSGIPGLANDFLFKCEGYEILLSDLRRSFLDFDKSQEEFVKHVNETFDLSMDNVRDDTFLNMYDLLYKVKDSSCSYIKNLFRTELKPNESSKIVAQGKLSMPRKKVKEPDSASLIPFSTYQVHSGTETNELVDVTRPPKELRPLPKCFDKDIFEKFRSEQLNGYEPEYRRQIRFAFIPGAIVLTQHRIICVYEEFYCVSGHIREVYFYEFTEPEVDEILRSQSNTSIQDSQSLSTISHEVDSKCSEENVLPRLLHLKDLAMAGFVCQSPKQDPLVHEILTTMPRCFKVALREWKYSHGVGDFVFGFKFKSCYHFIVAEVKNKKYCPTQLRKSVRAFNSCFRSFFNHGHITIWSIGIDCKGIHDLQLCSGPDYAGLQPTINGQIKLWSSDFLALRCAKPSPLTQEDQVSTSSPLN
jgi:DNA polymerase III delta prime subunit